MKGLGREGTCKKGCCWTPSGVCAKRGGCACHVSATTKHKILEEYLAEEGRKQKAMQYQDRLNEGHNGDY